MESPSTSAVVFAYHNVGVRCLKALLARGVYVPLVVTHEDNPSENIWFESVAVACREHGIYFITPTDLKSPELLSQVQVLRPDFIFSFYFRYMLPVNILEQAKHGAYNMHGSLLPKYRGRVPVNWAVLHGETETGVTLHEMVVKPDAGAIITQLNVPILPDDTAFEVFGKLTWAAEKALWDILPRMLEGNIPRHANDISLGSYFSGRKPEDGRIDWSRPAQEVYNLYRAVAPPYPGAWTEILGRKFTLRKARLSQRCEKSLSPGLAVLDGGVVGICGDGRLVLIQELIEDKQLVSAEALRNVLQQQPASCNDTPRMIPAPQKQVLILGINGFIGSNLFRRILETTTWIVYGMDLDSHRISSLLDLEEHKSRIIFKKGDITTSTAWIEMQIKKCDVVLPLAAIATPCSYVKNPLSVFKLDFEESLHVVRLTAKHGKRLVFPSTSEVYGMCHDEEFDPYKSEMVCGPTHKTRWIYSCSKQLIDRVIWAYGMDGLDFTLFRPFNWIGFGLDSLSSVRAGSSRVTTQFLGHIIRGEDIILVDGGSQKRTFTHIDDGIDALMKIIANERNIASGKIYNIGNPRNNYSIRELAIMMLGIASERPELAKSSAKVRIVENSSEAYYGNGYQDVQNRVPKITNTCEDLKWSPSVLLKEALCHIFDELTMKGGVTDNIMW